MSIASKQSFANVLSAEFKRTFGRSKALIAIGIFALVAIGAFLATLALMHFATNMVAEGMVEGADPSMAESVTSSYIGFGLPLSVLSLCFGLYAASLSARDYNDGTLLSTILTVPNRLRLFLSRLLPWAIMSLIVSAVVFAICLVVTLGQVTNMGETISQLLLSAVSCMCSTILGFCCGTLTKKGSLSVLLYLALTMLLGFALSTASLAVPESFRFIVDWINTALPGNAFSNFILVTSAEGESANALVACGVALAWTIGMPLVSYLLFKTRATLDR